MGGAALAGVLSGGALAGDWPEIKQVSFSADNARVLVQTAWQQDGSGFSRASLGLYDTGTGRALLRLNSLSQSPDLTPTALLERLTQGQKQRLAQVGLLERPVSKPRFVAATPSPQPQWSDAVRAGQSKTYSVFLWSRNVPIELKVQPSKVACAYAGLLPAGEGPATFTLKVNGQTIPTPQNPAVECAARYTLDRVDLSGNRVLLTVRAYAPGFEGPNAMPIFLAATLR